MFSRHAAFHIKRSYHFQCLNWFSYRSNHSCGNSKKSSDSSETIGDVFNKTVTVAQNAFSDSSSSSSSDTDQQIIMRFKRGAAEKLDLTPVIKKPCPQMEIQKQVMAENSRSTKMSVDSHSSTRSGDSKILRHREPCKTHGHGTLKISETTISSDVSERLRHPETSSSASPVVHHHDHHHDHHHAVSSSAENLEDSGIEVKSPVLDTALPRITGMPGFVLNPPVKSLCSGPMFSEASSDSGIGIPCTETSVQERNMELSLKDVAAEMKEVKEEMATEVKEVKEEMAAEVKTEMATEVKTEMATEVKTEMATEVKTEMATEVKTEMATEVKTEMATEVKTEMATEVKEEMATEVKEEVAAEVKEEVAAEVKEETATEVKEKMAAKVKEKLSAKMKEEVAVEVKEEMTAEMKEATEAEGNKELTTKLLEDVQHLTVLSSKDTTSGGGNTISADIPQKESVKQGLEGGGDCASSSVTLPISSQRSGNKKHLPPPVPVGKPSGDDTYRLEVKGKASPTTTATVSGSDTNPVSHRVGTGASKTTHMAQSRVSGSSARRCYSTDSDRLKSSKLSGSKRDEKCDSQSPRAQPSLTQSPPVPKQLKDKPKDHVTTQQHKTASPQKLSKDRSKEQVTSVQHKTSPPVPKQQKEKPKEPAAATAQCKTAPPEKQLKDKSREQVTAAQQKSPILKQSKDGKHVTPAQHVTGQSQTSKGCPQSTSSASKERQTEEKKRDGAQKKQDEQTKHKPSTHPQSGSRRKREAAQRNDNGKRQTDSSSSSAAVEKEIVKEAQEDNMARSANATPEKKKKKTVLPASLLKDVRKYVQENVGTVSKQVITARPSPASLTQLAVPLAMHSGAGVTTEVAVAKESLTANPADRENPVSKTSKNLTVQDAAAGDLSSDAQAENSPVANSGKDTVYTDPSSLRVSSDQDSKDANLPSVECLETEKQTSNNNSQMQQKAQEKAKKKKKKQNKRQRKSTGGESENFLGELPDYIPENDMRLNKKREDRVYNLSALFSGELLKYQSTPKRSRPNYFFAIQITNPQVKAGLEAVQQGVEEICPMLQSAFVSVDTAHLTLGVMHLPDDDAVSRVIWAMEEFKVTYLQQLQWQQETQQGMTEVDRLQDLTLEDTPPAPLDLSDSPTQQDSSSDNHHFNTSGPSENDTDIAGTASHADPLDTSVSSSASGSVSENSTISSSVPVESRDTTSSSSTTTTVSDDSAKMSVSSDSVGELKADSVEGEKSAQGEKSVPQRLTLEVRGLDSFHDNVVFAKVTEGADLNKVKGIAEVLRKQLVDLNIFVDPKPFAPHITLMKMSKNPGRLKAAGIRNINSKLYQDFSEKHFGSNVVTSIQLCAMLKPKLDNYYHVEHEIPVSWD